MNRLNKLSGISLVGSGGGEGGSVGTGAPTSGLTITKNGDAAGSNSKPNPLARLSHLNVSISGGNNKSGQSPGASPPATPPSSSSPTPQSSGKDDSFVSRNQLHNTANSCQNLNFGLSWPG